MPVSSLNTHFASCCISRDALSRKSQYYVDTFALLLSIKYHCLPYHVRNHSYYQTNMMLLSFQLDALFHDVVGLICSHNLAALPLPTRNSVSPDSAADMIQVDDLPLWSSKLFLFSSSPHLKDLCELLKELELNDGKMAITSSAKKVRPNTVKNLRDMDTRFSRISFSAENSMSPWSNKRLISPAARPRR